MFCTHQFEFICLLILMITRFLEMQHFDAHVPYQPVRRTCCLHLQGTTLTLLSRRPRQSEPPKHRFVTTETRDVTFQKSSSMALCCIFHSPCVPLVTPISFVSNWSPYWYLFEIMRQKIPIARCFSILPLRHIVWAQINLRSSLFSNVLYICSLSFLRMSIQASSTRRS